MCLLNTVILYAMLWQSLSSTALFKLISLLSLSSNCLFNSVVKPPLHSVTFSNCFPFAGDFYNMFKLTMSIDLKLRYEYIQWNNVIQHEQHFFFKSPGQKLHSPARAGQQRATGHRHTWSTPPWAPSQKNINIYVFEIWNAPSNICQMLSVQNICFSCTSLLVCFSC